MRRTVFLSLLLALAWLSATDGWSAEAPPSDIVPSSSVIGHRVQDPDGKDLGRIVELAIDGLDGRVRYAVLEFEAGTGKQEKYFAIPWDALRRSKSGKQLSLDVRRKYLRQAPGFDKDDWPAFADPIDYGTILDDAR